MSPSLEHTSLTDAERRAVARVTDSLAERLGDELVAVWLFGSKARGEAPGADSDIDMMVVARGGRDRHWRKVWETIEEVAPREGADPIAFSPHVVDPAWLHGRREIRSFFIQDVDRDKVVLAGES